MRRTLLKLFVLVLTVCLGVCAFVACGGNKEPEHFCAYNQEVVDSKYLKSEATCTARARYYKSCECGAKGTEEFTTGELLPHNFEEIVDEELKISDATCTQKAKYYKTCSCGAKSAKEEGFEAGELLEHTLLDHHDYETHYKFCSECEQKVEVEGHTLQNGSCSKCAFYPYSKGLELDLFEGDSWADPTDDYYIVRGLGECTDTNLIIPNVYENTPVKKIASGAFRNNAQIISVDIPANITYMSGAFEGCTALKTVTFRKNSQMQDMSSAFLGCIDLTSVSLPDGISQVDGFARCESLKTIKIPDSVETIGNSAFSNCSSLETVIFGENSRVKTIDNCAFMACLKLIEFDLPTTVTSIGEYAFAKSMTGNGVNSEETKTIRYNGTKQEFNDNVRRPSTWRFRISTIIVCTDGNIE